MCDIPGGYDLTQIFLHSVEEPIPYAHTMGWDTRLVEFQDDATPGYWYANLCRDGKGRVAFGCGRYVHVTPKRSKAFSNPDCAIIKSRADPSVSTNAVGAADADPTFSFGSDKVSCAHFWSTDVAPEPILFVATESNPPSIGVYREEENADSYRRLKQFTLGSVQHDVIVTAMGTIVAASGTLLALGLSTGKIEMYSRENDRFRQVCVLDEFTKTICCVRGDSTAHRGFVAASDDYGIVRVWEEKAPKSFAVVYKVKIEEDFAASLAIRGPLLLVGLFSGKLRVYDIEERVLKGEVVSNTRCITAIDSHPSENIVLVAGEDCRASILSLPSQGESQLRLIFSVCVSTVITGATFTCSEPASPNMSLALFDRAYIVQYNLKN